MGVEGTGKFVVNSATLVPAWRSNVTTTKRMGRAEPAPSEDLHRTELSEVHPAVISAPVPPNRKRVVYRLASVEILPPSTVTVVAPLDGKLAALVGLTGPLKVNQLDIVPDDIVGVETTIRRAESIPEPTLATIAVDEAHLVVTVDDDPKRMRKLKSVAPRSAPRTVTLKCPVVIPLTGTALLGAAPSIVNRAKVFPTTPPRPTVIATTRGGLVPKVLSLQCNEDPLTQEVVSAAASPTRATPE
mmetsp:Transcript_34185/g.78012  ORF Transcript_34185/g.78012 Transcript_34185/m.78012 type:complete len:244 (-) Transcript_34185:670-1401(-)